MGSRGGLGVGSAGRYGLYAFWPGTGQHRNAAPFLEGVGHVLASRLKKEAENARHKKQRSAASTSTRLLHSAGTSVAGDSESAAKRRANSHTPHTKATAQSPSPPSRANVL
jgi:hypothetical protein